MVLNAASLLKKIRVSRVVIVSGLMTFLFLIEFGIGVRGLYHVFSLWYYASRIPSNTPVVNLSLCVAYVLICVISFIAVNVISAIWEQKQMAENVKEKSPVKLALHLFLSGMVWRYVSLWFTDCKKIQKKEALLLTFVKFFFTQFFTIPMVIIHASSLENLEEVIYDLCSVLCISVNWILTCTMFTWCKVEVNELKSWKFETLDLIPLIFYQNTDDPQKPNATDQSNLETNTKELEGMNNSSSSEQVDDNVENALVQILVLFQTFFFTFGRLLALGILLKLAGIYSISILCLQLLISVVYLKFQVSFLVSDSLPKWRQLTRLAFMSYILIFEWHLNRDPNTGYDFNSNMKHSMLYYCVVTLESVFYFVTWAIAESYASSFNDINSIELKFSRNILIVGILSLITSLILHALLLFWQSRKLYTFVNSVQRRYLTSKLRINSRDQNRANGSGQNSSGFSKSQIEISNPIPMHNAAGGCSTRRESYTTLEKRNSYKDLRDPIDDEIEIYIRKKGNVNVSTEDIATEDIGDNTKRHYLTSGRRKSCSVAPIPGETLKRKIFEGVDVDLKRTLNCNDKIDKRITAHSKSPNCAIYAIDTHISVHSKSDCASTRGSNTTSTGSFSESEPSSDSKTKMTQFSESVHKKCSKFSSMSKKFTGRMKDQIQKRRDQFQNYRNPPTAKVSDLTQQNNESYCSEEDIPEMDGVSVHSESYEVDNSESSPTGNTSSLEAYFIGDSRFHQKERHCNQERDYSQCNNEEGQYSIAKVSIPDEDHLNDKVSNEAESCNADPELTDKYIKRDSRCSLKRHHKDQEQHGKEVGDDFSSHEETIDISDSEEETYRASSVVDLSEEEENQEEMPHVKGDDPCPCYLCKKGGGNLRRRSFSIPPADREHHINFTSEELSTGSSMVRCPSSPSIVRVEMRPEISFASEVKVSHSPFVPRIHLKSRAHPLSLVAVDSTQEHFV